MRSRSNCAKAKEARTWVRPMSVIDVMAGLRLDRIKPLPSPP
jgi:hypothetical protein